MVIVSGGVGLSYNFVKALKWLLYPENPSEDDFSYSTMATWGRAYMLFS